MYSVDAACCDVGAERRLSLCCELVPDTAASDCRGNRQWQAVYVWFEADQLISRATAGRQHWQMSRLLSRLQSSTV